jgi:hypothetical protein
VDANFGGASVGVDPKGFCTNAAVNTEFQVTDKARTLASDMEIDAIQALPLD